MGKTTEEALAEINERLHAELISRTEHEEIRRFLQGARSTTSRRPSPNNVRYDPLMTVMSTASPIRIEGTQSMTWESEMFEMVNRDQVRRDEEYQYRYEYLTTETREPEKPKKEKPQKPLKARKLLITGPPNKEQEE